MTLPLVRVVCMALPQGRERSCSTLLGYLPTRIRLSELRTTAPAEPDGRIAVRCSKCHTWNMFEILSTDGAPGVPGGELPSARDAVESR